MYILTIALLLAAFYVTARFTFRTRDARAAFLALMYLLLAIRQGAGFFGGFTGHASPSALLEIQDVTLGILALVGALALDRLLLMQQERVSTERQKRVMAVEQARNYQRRHDQQEAESALSSKATTGSYHEALDTLDAAVLVFEPETGTIWSNRRAREMNLLERASLCIGHDAMPLPPPIEWSEFGTRTVQLANGQGRDRLHKVRGWVVPVDQSSNMLPALVFMPEEELAEMPASHSASPSQEETLEREHVSSAMNEDEVMSVVGHESAVGGSLAQQQR